MLDEEWPEEQRLPLTDEDIRAIVRLVGGVAGLTESVTDRRRALVSGLAAMVEADVWAWTHTVGYCEGRPAALSIIDGGWHDDFDRARGWKTTFEPGFVAAMMPQCTSERPSTLVFDPTHPGWGDGSLHRDVLRPAGLEHLLFSIHPLGDGRISGIGLHRRVGRPAYEPREVAIVQLVANQVDWLHHIDPPPVAAEPGLRDLTPRDREVLLHLVGGGSRKQIARKLGLSEHTVGDHIKTLHRRLNVNSRSELMAKFLPAAPGG
jgi:DNA-binding CsgD family transcriptional regulator